MTEFTHEPFDAKLIKLCDISANLSDLKNYDASKSKKTSSGKTKKTLC